ncbi:MAG: XRE family transcriptional regulator [Spirochaetaceae bacterium]|nr:XRE family transcriptional regulator [Spirochaetaceae bacterium]
MAYNKITKIWKSKMRFNPISGLDARMNPETLAKARKLYEQESLNIKLKALRGKYGIKQEEVDNFSQTAVSKLEKRKDIKISTLIDYLESLGFGLEITALPKRNNAKKEVLLRT